MTAPETIANLAKGEYTLTETAVKGYAPLSVTFSVDESGYVVANHPDGSPIENNNCIFAANKVTAINRSQISVDKQDIADSAELAGATIKITRTAV